MQRELKCNWKNPPVAFFHLSLAFVEFLSENRLKTKQLVPNIIIYNFET